MSPQWRDVLPADPVVRWSDLVGFQRYKYEPDKKNAFDGALRFVQGAGVEPVEIDSDRLAIHALRFNAFVSVHVHVKSAHLRWAREHPQERARYLFIFANRGRVEAESEDSHWSTANGDLCIVFPGSSTVHMRVTELSEVLFFSFDQVEIAPFFLSANNVGEVSANSTVFRASYAYLQTIVRASSDVSPAEEDPVVLRAIIRDIESPRVSWRV